MYVLVYSNLALLSTSQTIQLNQNFTFRWKSIPTPNRKSCCDILKNIFFYFFPALYHVCKLNVKYVKCKV